MLLLAALFAAPLCARSAGPIDLEQISQVPAQLFDEGSGLPDLTVTAVETAPDGFVWVGTMRGVARFDGHRMTAVPGPDNALTGPIRDLKIEPTGQVWVATARNGVYRWDGHDWQRFDENVGLPAQNAIRLRVFAAEQGPRLFATGAGFVAEWDGKRWHPQALPDALADVEIFDVELLEQDGIQTLWIASFGQGLLRCVARAPCTSVTMPGPGPRFFEVSSLASVAETDGSTSLWVGSYGGGLARLNAGQWTRFHSGDTALTGDYVLRLQTLPRTGKRPQLWVGLRSGLARLRHGEFEMVAPVGQWANGRINSLSVTRDAQDNAQLWVGSDAGAARMRLQGNWRTISRAGQRGNGVWSVLFEADGAGNERLWLGTDGEGLLRYEGGEWQQYGTAEGLPTMTARTVVRVPDGSALGQLWVGTWDGHIARFDGARFREMPTPWPKFDREAVGVILPVSENEVYVGLRAGGVAHWIDGQWRRFDPADPVNPARVPDLQLTGTDGDRVLWATTYGRGLARLRDGQWRYFYRDIGLPADDLGGITLMPDAKGRQILWIGSKAHGVLRIDVSEPDAPRMVTTPALPDPPDRYVYGVERDGAGDLIVCTNYGAARWRPRADGSFDALTFHRSDGLPHDECNGGALTIDSLGRAWIGTIGGAAVYLPRPPGSEGAQAPLRIARVTADGVDRTADVLAGAIRLKADARSFDVQYSLLNGDREALTRYRTRLEPVEAQPGDWSDAHSRSFTGLPPGSYVLHVEARDYAGVHAKPLAVKFDIPLPWWRQPLAEAAFAIVALGAGLILLRWRERQSRQREQQLIELVRLRTHELETRGLELRRMNEELTRLSYHDALTDLANRRMLLERLHGEWELSQARGTSLAFLLFDLDQFKAYNDHRGHLAGDDCLRDLGHRIEAELRKPEDTAGRYGGEEFGVVLPGLSLDQAMVVAERIRRAVETAGLSHPTTPQGVVTISVGVAAMQPRPGLSAELLIAAADAALYRAKQTGKNRVEAASPDHPRNPANS